MKILGRADRAVIETDEYGFVLVIVTDSDRIVMRLPPDVAETLYETAGVIGDFLTERDYAEGTRPYRVVRDDLDGYSLDDPKRVELELQIH